MYRSVYSGLPKKKRIKLRIAARKVPWVFVAATNIWKQYSSLMWSPVPPRILAGYTWERRLMGILGPWSSLHTNNFVWLIQDGARSHCKNWVGSKIPPEEDPRSQIPDPRPQILDGATANVNVFRLQLDVFCSFLFRHSSSIAIFKETLWALKQVRIRNGIRFCCTCTGQCTLGCRRRKGWNYAAGSDSQRN